MAGEYDPCECTGDHVIYIEQGIYGTVQKYTVIHGCRTLTLNGLIIRFTGKNSYVLEYL